MRNGDLAYLVCDELPANKNLKSMHELVYLFD